MRWTLDGIIQATGGRLAGDAAPGATAIAGLSIDSRTLARGELFVAIVAERDGHDFALAAAGAGAAALLVARPTGAGGPEVVVADTTGALMDIGAAARRRPAAPVVGITGSVRKP